MGWREEFFDRYTNHQDTFIPPKSHRILGRMNTRVVGFVLAL